VNPHAQILDLHNREAKPELRETFPEVRETISEVREIFPKVRETIPEVRENFPEVRKKGARPKVLPPTRCIRVSLGLAFSISNHEAGVFLVFFWPSLALFPAQF
jgi:hypothetical protein